MEQQRMTEQESLQLIGEMISKAKSSYHDSGLGPILWGLVISVCGLVTWCEIQFNFELPFDIWILTLVAIIPQIIIVRREKKLQKVRRYDETIMDYVWTCFGFSIFLLIFLNANIVIKLSPVFEKYAEVTGSDPVYNYSSFITSFFLLLYGIPTIVTGGVQKLKTMFWGGILCWVCCVVSVYTSVKTDMLLIALSAVCAWLVPGLQLNRKYKKLKAANV